MPKFKAHKHAQQRAIAKKIAPPKKKANFNRAGRSLPKHSVSPEGRPMFDAADQLSAAEGKRLIKVFGLFIRVVQLEVLGIPEADAGGGANMRPVDLNSILEGLKALKARCVSIEAAFNSMHEKTEAAILSTEQGVVGDLARAPL